MHIAEVVTIAKSLPLLRLNTYKSLILSYSADYRRILRKKIQIIVPLMNYFHFIDYFYNLLEFTRCELVELGLVVKLFADTNHI